MRWKIFLTVAAVLFIAAGASEGAKTCIWSERWDVKTLADADAARINFRPEKISIKRLVRLRTWIQPLLLFTPRQGVEFRTFEVVSRIKSYSIAPDGDLNLVLADPGSPEVTIIAEAPDPDCRDMKKTRYLKVFRRVREEFRENCLGGGRIVSDGKDHPVSEGLYVVTGVGFVDFPHLQEGVAENNLELHPVLSIRKANLLIERDAG